MVARNNSIESAEYKITSEYLNIDKYFSAVRLYVGKFHVEVSKVLSGSIENFIASKGLEIVQAAYDLAQEEYMGERRRRITLQGVELAWCVDEKESGWMRCSIKLEQLPYFQPGKEAAGIFDPSCKLSSFKQLYEQSSAMQVTRFHRQIGNRPQRLSQKDDEDVAVKEEPTKAAVNGSMHPDTEIDNVEEVEPVAKRRGRPPRQAK